MQSVPRCCMTKLTTSKKAGMLTGSGMCIGGCQLDPCMTWVLLPMDIMAVVQKTQCVSNGLLGLIPRMCWEHCCSRELASGSILSFSADVVCIKGIKTS